MNHKINSHKYNYLIKEAKGIVEVHKKFGQYGNEAAVAMKIIQNTLKHLNIEVYEKGEV